MVIALKHSKLAKDNCCKKFSLKAQMTRALLLYVQRARRRYLKKMHEALLRYVSTVQKPWSCLQK